MKSNFLRILSMILILSFLVSMLSVFAFAEEDVTEDGEQAEEENLFELLYNRNYSEGWEVNNGLSYTANGGPETTFTVEYETTVDYEYNYFWRMEVNSAKNSFMSLDYNAWDRIGAVFEFDIMTDDVCNINNVINLATKGNSYTVRSDYNFLTVKDNQVYLFKDGDYLGFRTEDPVYTEPVATLTNEWLSFKLIFDYTYEKEPILESDTDEERSRKVLENNNWFQLYVYYGPASDKDNLTLWTGAPLVLEGMSGKGLQFFRLQTSGESTANFGTSICFDNLKAYTGVNELVDITPEMGCGKLVDEYADKTVHIIGGNAATAGQAFNEGLSMKVGVDYCYLDRTRTPIAVDENGNAYGAPVIVDGKVMVHLGTVLEHLGYPVYVHPDGTYIDVSTGVSATYMVVGKDTATVGDKKVQLAVAPGYITDENGNSYLAIALEDVELLFPGNYGEYDDMGFMIISNIDGLLNRNINLQSMVNIMKEFVFDYASGDEIYEDVKENTNNFQHPYLYGTPEQIETVYQEYMALNAEVEKFREMDNNYNGNPADYPEEFWMWVHYVRLINSGESAYKVYALPDANGSYETFGGLNMDDSTRNKGYSLAQPYLDAHGYDVGGRSDITNRTSLLERMAVAYAITRDIKYLQCAYEVSVILGEWTHWGPGHFLNCADSSADFAAYFDLTYNGYKELAAAGITRPNGEEYSTDVLATILFNQGVHEGYLSTFTGTTEHLSPVVGMGGCYYSERDNNWHAVCVSGMAAAALAVMGECDGIFVSEAAPLISDNLKTLVTYGMQQYVPDGSYIEGPGYWNYGTNTFFRLCLMLDNAAGTNYGLMDTWGIDRTCYYACHSESSDSRTFNFHDGSMSSQDTSYFFYVGSVFNDATLYDVRLNQINGNLKSAEFLDLVYYPRGMEIDADAVQLDYMPDSIDLFATRSGWERGSLYAAICGGTNQLGHGQIDAGSFVYHNGGNVWIIDLGTENYNCEGFWPASTRYRFYVMKPEGNNTLALTSDLSNVPYGQILSSTAPAIGSGSNTYGAYVVYDMSDTFGVRAKSWTRGMLLTNDRKTTIIQDELVLDSMQSVYWFAHYYLQNGYASSYGVEEVEIAPSGQVAYLKQYTGMNEHGEKMYQTLRLTIVTDNPSFKFQIMDTYTFVHNDPNYGTYYKFQGANGEPEHDRSRYRKLAISSGMVLDFKLAVVMEMIDTNTIGKTNEIDVGYKFTKMSTWEPTTDMRGMEVEDNEISRRGAPNVSNHLVKGMNLAKAYVNNDIAYNDMIHDYYKALTDAYYVVRILGSDLPSDYSSYKNTLKEYRAEFAKYREEVNKVSENKTELVYKLMGLK